MPLLEHVLATALRQHNELIGEVFPVLPRLDAHDDLDFWALVERDHNRLVIRLGGGVVTAVETLWNTAFTDNTFLAGASSLFVADKADVIHVSLVWLMLHELQHVTLGHFDLLGQDYVAETHRARRFALVSQAPAKPDPLAGIDRRDRHRVEPCLELQADHDAIEMVLDAYSPDEWPSLRARVAAVSAMMMLIEREDAKLVQGHSSHPKAATRIFQLLGHVTEMPTIPAQLKAASRSADRIDSADLPSEEEQSAFNREVVLPAFFDAVHLASVAEADTIRSDLGEAADFFGDIQIAKLGDAGAFANLKTVGARQWADLMAFNEVLKEIQGI